MTHVASADRGPIAVTVDTEWAHPLVLADLLDILERFGVKATLFCTGPVEARGHEVAIHPNFRRGGDAVRRLLAEPANAAAAWDDSFVYRAVLAEMRATFPDAIGSRSHSLIYDSALLPELAAAGFRYDSTYMTPLRCVAPFPKEHGIWEIPIYYMDHVDLVTQASGFRLDGLGLEQPGLKVFDFHPNMVFIDARSEPQYLESKASYHDPQALLSYRSDGGGVRELLVALLEHVRSEAIPLTTLSEVYRDVSADGGSGARDAAILGSAPSR
jgi:peptidoglycan/xylan/chitin deacetylase (PgdA/CDA1 family)